MDIAAHLVAFQAINRVKVVLRMEAGDWKGCADVGVTAVAYCLPADSPDLAPLASVRLNLLATNLRQMDAAVIHLLYMLDAQLASGEYAKVLDK